MTMRTAHSSFLKFLGAVVVAVTSMAGLAAGFGTDTSVDTTRNGAVGGIQPTCETLRSQFEQEAKSELGLDLIDKKMSRISAALSARDRNDLMVLAQELERPRVQPQMRADATQTMRAIYARSIERAGLTYGASERVPAIGRTIMAEPTTVGLTHTKFRTHGQMIILTSAPRGHAIPKAGDIAEAHLIVTPDQRHREFVLMRVQQVTQAPHGGYDAPLEEISLTEHVESLLPPSCRR